MSEIPGSRVICGIGFPLVWASCTAFSLKSRVETFWTFALLIPFFNLRESISALGTLPNWGDQTRIWFLLELSPEKSLVLTMLVRRPDTILESENDSKWGGNENASAKKSI